MTERITLVTGANRLVPMGARERKRGEKATADLWGEGLKVESIEMNLTSQEVVGDAAAEIERRHGRLDRTTGQ